MNHSQVNSSVSAHFLLLDSFRFTCYNTGQGCYHARDMSSDSLGYQSYTWSSRLQRSSEWNFLPCKPSPGDKLYYNRLKSVVSNLISTRDHFIAVFWRAAARGSGLK